MTLRKTLVGKIRFSQIIAGCSLISALWLWRAADGKLPSNIITKTNSSVSVSRINGSFRRKLLLMAQATGDVCELPQVIGTGPYRIPRWYFNPNTKRCELFYYSGCCGNGNNYPTYESCQVLCEGGPKRKRRKKLTNHQRRIDDQTSAPPLATNPPSTSFSEGTSTGHSGTILTFSKKPTSTSNFPRNRTARSASPTFSAGWVNDPKTSKFQALSTTIRTNSNDKTSSLTTSKAAPKPQNTEPPTTNRIRTVQSASSLLSKKQIDAAQGSKGVRGGKLPSAVTSGSGSSSNGPRTRNYSLNFARFLQEAFEKLNRLKAGKKDKHVPGLKNTGKDKKNKAKQTDKISNGKGQQRQEQKLRAVNRSKVSTALGNFKALRIIETTPKIIKESRYGSSGTSNKHAGGFTNPVTPSAATILVGGKAMKSHNDIKTSNHGRTRSRNPKSNGWKLHETAAVGTADNASSNIRTTPNLLRLTRVQPTIVSFSSASTKQPSSQLEADHQKAILLRNLRDQTRGLTGKRRQPPLQPPNPPQKYEHLLKQKRISNLDSPFWLKKNDFFARKDVDLIRELRNYNVRLAMAKAKAQHQATTNVGGGGGKLPKNRSRKELQIKRTLSVNPKLNGQHQSEEKRKIETERKEEGSKEFLQVELMGQKSTTRKPFTASSSSFSSTSSGVIPRKKSSGGFTSAQSSGSIRYRPSGPAGETAFRRHSPPSASSFNHRSNNNLLNTNPGYGPPGRQQLSSNYPGYGPPARQPTLQRPTAVLSTVVGSQQDLQGYYSEPPAAHQRTVTIRTGVEYDAQQNGYTSIHVLSPGIQNIVANRINGQQKQQQVLSTSPNNNELNPTRPLSFPFLQSSSGGVNYLNSIVGPTLNSSIGVHYLTAAATANGGKLYPFNAAAAAGAPAPPPPPTGQQRILLNPPGHGKKVVAASSSISHQLVSGRIPTIPALIQQNGGGFSNQRGTESNNQTVGKQAGTGYGGGGGGGGGNSPAPRPPPGYYGNGYGYGGGEVARPRPSSLLSTPPTPFLINPTSATNNQTATATGGGIGPTSLLEILSNNLPGPDRVCQLDVVIGGGPYKIPRWWFNLSTGRCELFYYSGCCGNSNNFPTCQLCQSMCEVDPCTQDRDPGVGSLQIQRHFFNRNTKLCEQFTYFGSGGNRNNFATVDDCRARCPESPNPCGFGEAMRTGNGGMMQCGFSLVVTNTCPANYYCHVGSSVTTTVCCPKGGGDRCSQPLSTGIGTNGLPRWSFDSVSQQCREFQYKGLQGNENNFLSKADCDNACFINPCSQGTPYRSGGTVVQCSAVNQNVCPSSYYCHIGADSRTTVCCQSQGECVGGIQQGVGRSAVTRWGFDSSTRQCVEFTYFGLGGNANSFLSKSDCMSTCPVYKSPCQLGSPCVDTTGQQVFQCSAQNQTCPPDYYCHVGADRNQTLCCPAMQDPPCFQEKAHGTGSDKLPRWYFDKTTKQCTLFSYSGIEGNQNNFLTHEQCNRNCKVNANVCSTGPPVLDRFGQPLRCSLSAACPPGQWCHFGLDERTTFCCPKAETFPCGLALAEGSPTKATADGSSPLNRPSTVPRWFYDNEENACKQFEYTGQGGNQNNFLAQSECSKRCPEYTNPCPIGEPMHEIGPSGFDVPVRCDPMKSRLCPDRSWCHVGANAETTFCCPKIGDLLKQPCDQPLSNGTGLERIRRYYFNEESAACEPFEYFGLRGNENNFETFQECERRCAIAFQRNPCSRGQPQISVDGNLVSCDSGGCAQEFYCHVGKKNVGDEKICCPSMGDPCNMTMTEGTGTGREVRWFYHAKNRRCETFEYRGSRGNDNNFLTKRDCNAKCKKPE